VFVVLFLKLQANPAKEAVFFTTHFVEIYLEWWYI